MIHHLAPNGKILDSTGTFVSVLAAIRQHVGDMQARLLFVPNRIDPRVGTKECGNERGTADVE